MDMDNASHLFHVTQGKIYLPIHLTEKYYIDLIALDSISRSRKALNTGLYKT